MVSKSQLFQISINGRPTIFLRTASLIISLIISTLCGEAYSQQVIKRANLQSEIKESSGLLLLNDQLITHTDSDGKPILYEMSKETGDVLRAVEIRNAANTDWEDITKDESYIYIGDFGNNDGNRTDLKLYKISISDYLNTPNDKVSAEIISFNYSNQTDFSSNPYDTNFDAEALVAYNERLYIFTKNWSDYHTDIYEIPKEPGSYSLNKLATINCEGLISGATFNAEFNSLILSGYNDVGAFVLSIENIEDNNFSEGSITIDDLNIPEDVSYQIEGIEHMSGSKYHLTSESGIFGQGALMELSMDTTLSIEGIEKIKDSIFPNPATDFVQLRIKDLGVVQIFDSKGVMVKESKSKKIFVGNLKAGVYILKAVLGSGLQDQLFKLIVN